MAKPTKGLEATAMNAAGKSAKKDGVGLAGSAPRLSHRRDGYRTTRLKIDLAKAITHIAVDNGLTLTDLIDYVLRRWIADGQWEVEIRKE